MGQDGFRIGDEELVIRRAVEADVPAIVELLADDPIGAGRESADLAPYRRAFAAIDADPSELLVVVTDAATTVGTMQLSFLPGLSRGGALRAQIEGVRVGRGSRGQGIGEAMIRWATREARRRGCSLVQLTSDKSRVDAGRFYARLGFVASHEGFKLDLG